nr:hypothetical protein RSP673_07610 [Ralstonia solanacearum P673]
MVKTLSTGRSTSPCGNEPITRQRDLSASLRW